MKTKEKIKKLVISEKSLRMVSDYPEFNPLASAHIILSKKVNEIIDYLTPLPPKKGKKK